MSARDEWMETQSERKEYVLGFCFMRYTTEVVLIRKNKPEWQKGLLNGVGGKIEPGETPRQAMEREWNEETGSVIVNWIPYITMIFSGATVHVFKFRVPNSKYIHIRSVTDEAVFLFPVSALPGSSILIPNLKWLIPMALHDSQTDQPHWKGAPTLAYP